MTTYDEGFILIVQPILVLSPQNHFSTNMINNNLLFVILTIVNVCYSRNVSKLMLKYYVLSSYAYSAAMINYVGPHNNSV